MRNPISKQFDVVRTQVEDALKGLETHEVILGIKQNTGESLGILLGLADTKENAFQANRKGKLDAVIEQRKEDRKASDFIALVRDHLKRKISSQWSQAWVEVGFVNNSLEIPRTMGERQAMLPKLKAYLAAHPAYQAADAGLTPEEAQARHTAFAAARGAVNGCRSVITLAKGERDKAVRNLCVGLRGLFTELKQKLPGDDGRWRAFGFNPPDAVGLPAKVMDLVVNPAGAGHLLATWPHAALGERYRIYRRIMGVDSDYVLVKTVTELEADINSMASGQVVRVRVSAVNDAGEGQLSDPVEQTVP